MAQDHKTSLLDTTDLHNCDQHINIISMACDQEALLLDKKVTLEIFRERVTTQKLSSTSYMDVTPRIPILPLIHWNKSGTLP